MGKKVVINYQSVLYNQGVKELERSLQWLDVATKRVSLSKDVQVNVLFGDCSPNQVIGSEMLKNWQEVFKDSFELHYFFFGKNLGHGGAQNRLSNAISSDYLIFANPDIIVPPDTITLLLSRFEAEPNLALVDARQIPLEHPKEYDRSGETSWCSGAFMMTRTSIFRGVGEFDHENFFMHGDDVDLSWRIKMMGFSIKFVSEVFVCHPKYLSQSLSISTTDTELTHSALSSLLLPYKWSRMDVFESIHSFMAGSPDQFHQKAVLEFNRRLELGTLPTPIDPDNLIAVFEAGNYAKHRW